MPPPRRPRTGAVEVPGLLRPRGARGAVRRRRPLRPGLRRQRRRHERLRRGGRAGAAARRRRARRRRQGGADAELHERRGPRPVVARAPRRAGGARPRGARDRDAGGHRAGRRASLRQRGSAPRVRPPCCSRGCPARKAAPPSPTRSRARQPGGKLPDLVPALGRPGPGLLRPQGLRRQVALARRLRRRADVAALPLRARPRLHALRAGRPGRADAGGWTGTTRHGVGVGRERRARSPARR